VALRARPTADPPDAGPTHSVRRAPRLARRRRARRIHQGAPPRPPTRAGLDAFGEPRSRGRPAGEGLGEYSDARSRTTRRASRIRWGALRARPTRSLRRVRSRPPQRRGSERPLMRGTAGAPGSPPGARPRRRDSPGPGPWRGGESRGQCSGELRPGQRWGRTRRHLVREPGQVAARARDRPQPEAGAEAQVGR